MSLHFASVMPSPSQFPSYNPACGLYPVFTRILSVVYHCIVPVYCLFSINLHHTSLSTANILYLMYTTVVCQYPLVNSYPVYIIHPCILPVSCLYLPGFYCISLYFIGILSLLTQFPSYIPAFCQYLAFTHLVYVVYHCIL